MKIRSDFVTNSSSSSFLIGRKNELTNTQKQKLLEYIENNFLGKPLAYKKEELDEFMEETYGYDVYGEAFKNSFIYPRYKKALELLERGMVIYSGLVDFEESDWKLANIYQSIWEILEQDNDNFNGIKTELSY